MLTTAATHSAISSIWKNALNMVLDVLAMGADPKNTTFYLQSNVKEMPYFYTLIQNFIDIKTIQNTPSLLRTINEMRENASMNEISLGLLAYPVMEAADILSLKADVVTVGQDNIDHVEIAKKIANKINCESNYQLKSPRYITNSNNHIVGIDGHKKMSKSLNNCIYIEDTTDMIAKKVFQMQWNEANPTDCIVADYLNIFHLCAYGKPFAEINYSLGERFCKQALIEALETILAPMRTRRKVYSNDKKQIEDLLLLGTEQVNDITHDSLAKLKKGLGYDSKYCI